MILCAAVLAQEFLVSLLQHLRPYGFEKGIYIGSDGSRQGDTVRVYLPIRIDLCDFSTTIRADDFRPTIRSEHVTLEYHSHITVDFEDRDLTLSIDSFSRCLFDVPATLLAERILKDLPMGATLVTATLPTPAISNPTLMEAVQHCADPDSGLSIRAMFVWDAITNRRLMRVDILYGVAQVPAGSCGNSLGGTVYRLTAADCDLLDILKAAREALVAQREELRWAA